MDISPARPRSPSPHGRSLISRLKAPFGAKARNVPEFFIQAEDAHREYAPGDVVRGSVVLKVIRALRITHLVVKLHAYAQVYKAPNNPGEGYKTYSQALAQGKTRKNGGYYGSGIAALFEDEIVLCGDGRLGEGTYHFNFELQLPGHALPSSINFERGTINYQLTATLTRPTTIAPTMTCDQDIRFKEHLDIAKLQKPKPRIISLQPIVKRGKARRHMSQPGPTSDAVVGASEGGAGDDAVSVSNGTQGGSPPNSDAEPPLSPCPSRVSFDSGLSSGGAMSTMDTNSISGRTGDSKLTPSRRNRLHSITTLKAITAKIELQQAGYLPGDNLTLTINVNHTKAVKSLNGVVVTLYRQARVDYQPALTRINIGKGEESESSPKMKGSTGLSLSSGTKSHLFRKDLSQAFASLVVNPNTLNAEIRTSVRLPEDVFPTISNVPGSMISFKYYIEVVLDLQNKLAGWDRFLPNAGMSGISTHPGAGWSGHCIDTEEIRRDKGVVSCIFEVIVGTQDSSRKSKWKLPAAGPSEEASDSTPQTPRQETNAVDHATTPQPTDDAPSYDEHMESSGILMNGHNHDRNGKAPIIEEEEAPPPPHDAYPLPSFAAEEEGLSEKERLRRAEARLLPSAPPGDDEEPLQNGHISSNDLYDDDDATPHGSYIPSAPHLNRFAGSSMSTSWHDSYPDDMQAGPSAPAYDEVTGSTGGFFNPTSAPQASGLQNHLPSAPDGHAINGDSIDHQHGTAPATLGAEPHTEAEDSWAPSAPTLEELSLEYAGPSANRDSLLPRYQR